MYPVDRPDTFGCSAMSYRSYKAKRGKTVQSAYGWTVGLDVPTREAVYEEIDNLRRESVG